MNPHALLLLLATGIAASDETKLVREELEKFEGTWALVSSVRDGKEVPEEDVKETRLVIKGTKYRIPKDTAAGKKHEGTFKIDPTGRPGLIEATPADGPNKDKALLGIYEIKGDRLRVCFAPPDGERPTKFGAAEGSGHMLQEWKRLKE